MSVTRDLLMFGRLAAHLPAFLRRRVTLEEARATIRRRLETRAERFLDVVERGVYGHPQSPYLPLLREARCELGDLRSMVADRGLEGTLEALRDAGVYVTFEEFKGRTPIERNGVVVDAGPGAFHNPLTKRHFTSRSTGSTGSPTEVPYDLDNVLDLTPYGVVACDVQGVLDAPTGLWRCAPPLGRGLTMVLRSIITGNVVRRWFSPMGSDEVRVDRRFRVATALVLRECRLLGYPVPSPELVTFPRAVVIARWAAATASAEGKCLVRTGVSMALRVAVAAVENGIGLDGVTFMGGGEPPTPAKIAGIHRSGARCVPQYAAEDIGLIGLTCANPANESDVHFLEDGLALLQMPRAVPGLDREIDAFCFTTLLETSPRLLLNVEVDDFGTVERRSCGCPYEALGYGTHLWGVRSYRKLTGEGINLVDGDMIRILEEVLPARFGGSPHDYQLHEREDADGFTRLVLVVDPRVDLPGEGEVIGVVLGELARGDVYADSAREHWEQASTFRIERREPEWKGRKFPPLVVHRV